MSYVLNINKNIIYNFLEKYSQGNIFDFLNFEINNCNLVNIYYDEHLQNKY